MEHEDEAQIYRTLEELVNEDNYKEFYYQASLPKISKAMINLFNFEIVSVASRRRGLQWRLSGVQGGSGGRHGRGGGQAVLHGGRAGRGQTHLKMVYECNSF